MIDQLRPSGAIAYSRGASGHPCLMDLCKVKLSKGFPLTLILAVALPNRADTMFLKLTPTPVTIEYSSS